MNKEQNSMVVQNFLKLMSERKLEDLIELFSEKVDWFIPGDNEKAPWLGKRSTKKEVKNFYELLWQNTEPVSAQVDHILVDESIALITGEFKTKMLQTNKIIESPFSIEMTIENGLIKKYRLLENSFEVSKSLS